jgi:hypothetical protein
MLVASQAYFAMNTGAASVDFDWARGLFIDYLCVPTRNNSVKAIY